MSLAAGRLLTTRPTPAARFAPLVRLGAALVLIPFGVGKFTAHASEVDSFRNYGLPGPDAFVYVIGVLEVGCGALLLAGALTRVAALVMTGDMIGAITVSGIGEGEAVPSLTLAPALLAGMLFLLIVGPGSRSIDSRIARRVTEGGPAETVHRW
jgi:uncharacterized membrane protein YphA (DoxX/SURF4 family)